MRRRLFHISEAEVNYDPLVLFPTEGQGYQPAAGLMSNCPETEVNDHPSGLGVECDQHVELPNGYKSVAT